MKTKQPLSAAEHERRRKNRRLFIGIALCFAIPLLSAKIILDMGWYNPGVTNKGEFIEPPVEASIEDKAALPDTWRIAVRVPAECDATCVNGLYVINQSDLALGRETGRVTPVAILADDNVDGLPQLSPDSTLEYLVLPQLHEQLAPYAGSLFIIDPLGFVILRYDGSDDRETAIQRGGDLMDDLKKLLKMSRVG